MKQEILGRLKNDFLKVIGLYQKNINQYINMIKMKKYFTLLLFIGLAWCQMQGEEAGKVNFQNLIFYNVEDTIIFKEKELMIINGQEYHYLGLTSSDNNIDSLNLGMTSGRNVKISVDNIFTFQKYKRFPTKSIRYGMIATSLINGLFGFAIGFAEGTDNYDGPLPKGTMDLKVVY